MMAAQLANGLRSEGMHVSVLSLQPANSGRDVGEDLTRIPLKNIYWPYDKSHSKPSSIQRLAWHVVDTSNPWMTKQVINWAEETKPDLICTHNLQGFSTAIWPALKKLNVPIVHVLHDFSLLCPRTVLFKNGLICNTKNQRCTECRWLTAPRTQHCASVSAVVGVSHFVLQLHREHGLFTNIPGQVIHNTLSDEQRLRAPPAFSRSDKLRLGFLGRLDIAKGLNVLLAAAELLEHKIPVQWVLAGRGQAADIDQWQAQYPTLDIQWRGHIDPDTLWPDIDALIFPSNSYEALGNVILEAGAAGRASIASRHGGCVELIDEGLSGALFEPGNPHDLARVIEALHRQSGRWESMGQAARIKAQGFDESQRLQLFTHLFEDVLHAHGRSR